MLHLIGAEAAKLGVPAYVVGGYVRDRLMGRPTKDIDIVCVGSGIALAQNVASQLFPRPKITIYQRFGTAMIRHRDMEVEFVGARKESYRHDSRKPLVEDGTLMDDQLRRDLTINALAVSLNEQDFGAIIDSFNGVAHLEGKLLKTPLDPNKTFSDDPLRMLRTARFATQLRFTIDPATFKAMADNRERIRIVSWERITAEMEKILAAPKPSIGFKILFDTKLLHLIIPEMAALQGVEVRNRIGHKDNFYHTLEVVDNVARKTDNIWLRWAAVMHDIAKPPTKRFDPAQGWTFHGHEVLGAAWTARIFNRMKLPTDHRMKYVQQLVRLHLRPISLSKEEITDSAIRRLLFDAGDDIDDLMLLCEADITSKNHEKVQRYLGNYELVRERLKEVEEKDHIRNWQPPMTGDIIMQTFGIGPSREIGILKSAIKDAILDGIIPNDYGAAYGYMLEQADKLGLNVVDDSLAVQANSNDVKG